MNIFFVDHNPKQAALDLPDKLIVKMPTETAQIMSSVVLKRLKNNLTTSERDGVVKNLCGFPVSTYLHPATLWAEESYMNFIWLYKHGLALCEEYFSRYHKQHGSMQYITFIVGLLNANLLHFAKYDPTPHPLLMPDEFKDPQDPIASYRRYILSKWYVVEDIEKAYQKALDIPYWIYQTGQIFDC